MNTSPEINEIAKAMSLAQSQMKPAIKDSTNPHYKSKYSDISSVWEAIREPITLNGMTIWQDVTTQEKAVSVTTRIVHSSGQWVEFGPLSIPITKQDAHGVGSGVSYAKRYALCAAVGVVSSDEDDDANHAVGKAKINSYARSPEIEEFIKGNPEKFEYAKLIIKNSGKPEGEVIQQILNNLDRFNEAFNKWKSDNLVENN